MSSTAEPPRRIKLSRSKGWRKPPNTVVVSRPSRWGNPFPITDLEPNSRRRAVDRFGVALDAGELRFTIDQVRAELAGKNLGCWCPADLPCHGDILLAVANGRQQVTLDLGGEP